MHSAERPTRIAGIGHAPESLPAGVDGVRSSAPPSPGGDGPPNLLPPAGDLPAQCGSLKPDANRGLRLRILRSLTPAQKLQQVFDLNRRAADLFRAGLRLRFPRATPEEVERLYREQRARWIKKNS